eukprot:m.258242 g.258242  ORF g.258242 m.258242 type:complete len:60 (-) comp29467_c0_seq1:70-249(-)
MMFSSPVALTCHATFLRGMVSTQECIIIRIFFFLLLLLFLHFFLSFLFACNGFLFLFAG